MSSSSQRQNFASRRAEFKTPPRARESTQEERRARALEEQKRQRALRVNAARNIDLLSSLSLGAEGDDGDGEEDDYERYTPEVVREGIGNFASMLEPSSDPHAGPSGSTPASFSSSKHAWRSSKKKKSKKKKPAAAGANVQDEAQESVDPTVASQNRRSRHRGSKYANVCMFAELLELRDDDATRWEGNENDMEMDVPSTSDAMNGALSREGHEEEDGVRKGYRRRALPTDLETGWVVLAPIPIGKRCLAVSQQSFTNSATAVTSTHLRSRLKGTLLLKFPSPLPPDSILDCILDSNWQENGILHVLDIIRWRGTDFADCEAEFRFWWRDARLSEITPLQPTRTTPEPVEGENETAPSPAFEYPFLFAPVPHCTPPIPLKMFAESVIPASRTIREIPVTFSVAQPTANMDANQYPVDELGRVPFGVNFDFSSSSGANDQMTNGSTTEFSTTTMTARIPTDGMLLYVSEASYQPGETPLSCWIPARRLDDSDGPSMLDVFERIITQQLAFEPDQILA